MSLNSSSQPFAGLRCRVFDSLPPETSPQKLLILCHGFGAPGDDLASFGPQLLQADEQLAATCRLVFPEAPLDLTSAGMPGGRAWWQINMAALAEMHQTRDFEKLMTLEPPGMSEATAQFADAVREIQKANGLSDAETALGGFSQGAMISTNAVLQHGFAPHLLVLFSGCLLWKDTWTASAASHPGCNVLQSHGRQDMVLPFSGAEALRDMLSENNFSVEFRRFEGPHTIPPDVLLRMVQIISEAS